MAARVTPVRALPQIGSLWRFGTKLLGQGSEFNWGFLWGFGLQDPSTTVLVSTYRAHGIRVQKTSSIVRTLASNLEPGSCAHRYLTLCLSNFHIANSTQPGASSSEPVRTTQAARICADAPRLKNLLISWRRFRLPLNIISKFYSYTIKITMLESPPPQ